MRSSSRANSYVLSSGSIGKITSIHSVKKHIFITADVYENAVNLFSKPMKSSDVGIHKFDRSKFLVKDPLPMDIVSKVMCFDYKKHTISISLLH